MARIFLSFYNGVSSTEYELPVFYEAFIKGLEKYGNQVLVHSTKIFEFDESILPPSNLLKKIRDFAPDLIILFNNNFYNYDLNRKFSCPVIVYEVDSPEHYSNKNLLKSHKNEYKYILPYTDSIKIVHEDFNVPYDRICQAPIFTEVKSEKIIQNKNISFIGNPFSPLARSFADFLERDFFYDKNLELLEKFEKGIEFIPPNFPFDKGRIWGVISHKKRIQILKILSELDLHIYGFPFWNGELLFSPDLKKCYHKEKVFSLQDNQNIYNSSKIGISVAHQQAKSAFPWRIMDIMASNAVLVSDWHSDFDLYFKKYKFPTYKSPQEAYDICKRLLKNPNERQDIIENSHEIIENNFRFEHHLVAIENFVGINLHNKHQKQNFKTEYLPILNDFDTKRKHYFLYLDRRIKIIFLSIFCIFCQIPFIDLLLNKKIRKKILQSLKDTWR